MITKTCTQCGKEFILNDGEIAFYKKKRLHLPNRCKECREANKLKHSKEHQSQRGNVQSVRINGEESIHVVKKDTDIIQNEPIIQSGVEQQLTTSKPKRRFTLFAIVFLLFCILGYFGIKYWVPDLFEQQENQKDTESYTFKSEELFTEHFNKHASEFPYDSKEEYLAGANAVICHKDALHKTEAEDGDDIYYLEKTNEIVFVSSEHFIRTYFKPDSGKSYFDKQ
ncbi:MAG: zinc-ribbon domain containing protein [Clostridiales bacterium]|nr:zinc-ribbon domain containing protein [Clostridiales bacterium]